MGAPIERRVFRYSLKPFLFALGLVVGANVLAAVIAGFNPIGATIITLVFGGMAAYQLSVFMRTRLLIDDVGVELIESGESKLVRWNDIEGVTSAPIPDRPKVRRYGLLKTGAQVLAFNDDIADAERAVRTIERRVSVDIYPKLREALDRGETVAFGPIALGRSTIALRTATLRLGEGRIVRSSGNVQLMRTNGEIVQSVDEGAVPNLNLLLRCMSELESNAFNPR